MVRKILKITRPCLLSSTKHNGFTLVEIIIVVAILGILAAIAIPVYQNYITTSKQSAAQAVLEQFPILLETFRAENGQFPGAGNYTYTEAAAGLPATTSTIMTGAGLAGFAPRPAAFPLNKGIPFNYSLTIARTGTTCECAAFTATGVREAVGINVNGMYPSPTPQCPLLTCP